MESHKYAKLISAVYDVLEFFPDEEPLKIRAKNKALDLAENLALALADNNPQLSRSKSAQLALKDIEVVKGYLSLAKERKWLDSLNLFILLEEFSRVVGEIRQITSLFPEQIQTTKIKPISQTITPVDNNVNKAGISERQTRILKILETQEKAQVADIKKTLPEVSKRTIRRDLDDLLKMGKVERAGEFNQIFYKFVKKALPVTENTNIDRTKLLS